MEAVITSGGKQYRVSPGQVISVEKLPGDKGGVVEFRSVLLVTRDGGEVVRQARSRKISVVKFRRRKNYRRNRGHRQAATTVRITNIEV